MVDMSQEPISWLELSLLTHHTQVERFGFCMCEDNEGNENPYEDCPEEVAEELLEWQGNTWDTAGWVPIRPGDGLS